MSTNENIVQEESMGNMLIAKYIIAVSTKNRLMRKPTDRDKFIKDVLERGKDSNITEDQVLKVMSLMLGVIADGNPYAPVIV